MTRVLTTTVAIALLVGCKDKEAEAAAQKADAAAAGATAAAALVPVFASTGADKLIPGRAKIVGSVDFAGLQKSELYKINEALVTAQAKDLLEVGNACSLGIDKMQRFTFGMDVMANQFAVVIDATGIGKADTLKCLHAKIKEKEGRDPWTAEEREGRQVLTMKDGTGYVMSDDRLAVSSQEWQPHLRELVEGQGTSAFKGELEPVIKRADTDKVFWMAGSLPAELVNMTPMKGAKDFAAAIDVGSGVALNASFGFGNASEASMQRTEIQTQFDQVKGMAASMGVPQGFIDSVQVVAKDTTVVLTVKASDADLRALQQTVMKGMGG